MAAFSDLTEARVLNWFRGVAMPAPPAAVFLALLSADSDDGNTVTEATAAVRPAGRVAVTFGAVEPDTVDAARQRIRNTAAVDFGVAAGAATLTHVGFYDALSGGALLAHGAVTGAPRTIQAGDPVVFPVGELALALG